MAVRVAIANHKGGVGKSTSSLMIAEALAATLGLRVLVIDMDPQASVSTMLLSASGADRVALGGRSIMALLERVASGAPVQLSKVITSNASDLIELRDYPGDARVDLIASASELLIALTSLESQIRSRYRAHLDVVLMRTLSPELDRIGRSYDVVLFDCPAGTGPLSLAAVRLSRYVIAPTVLDEISVKALKDFISIVLAQQRDAAGHFELKVLPAIFRTGDPVQSQMLDQIRSGAVKLNCFRRPVPDTVHVRRATHRIRPNSYRTLREKYASLASELHPLAKDVRAFILPKEKAK